MHTELGTFLRDKRRMLQAPNGVTRRRTPGMRREEVAERAGISPDWYTRLEQDRAVPSRPTLDRLAVALQLSEAERQYLFLLAGRSAERKMPTRPDAHPSTQAALRYFDSVPACILTPQLDVLEANALHRALFLGLGEHPQYGQNLLWFLCCDVRARTLFIDHRSAVADSVAAFRLSMAEAKDKTGFQHLVDELGRTSPIFAEFWACRDVMIRRSGTKRFQHPQWQEVHFNWACIASLEAPAQLIAYFEPANEATRVALLRHAAGEDPAAPGDHSA